MGKGYGARVIAYFKTNLAEEGMSYVNPNLNTGRTLTPHS